MWGKFYVDGNYIVGNTNATNDNWTYGVYNQFHSTYTTYPSSCTNSSGATIPCEYTIPVSNADKIAMKLDTPFEINNNVTTHSAVEAYNKILLYGGASLVRDVIDTRIINETSTGTFTYNGSLGSTKGIIDTQSDVGGWPTYNATTAPLDTDNDGMPDAWEDTKGLNKNSASDGISTSLDGGYTNVEVYLNSLVETIINNQNQNSLSVDNNNIDNSIVELYPVPFKNQFYINIKKAEKIEQISIFNALGQQIRLIKTNEIKNQTLKIDVNASGGNIFIVKIVTANGIINKTIINK